MFYQLINFQTINKLQKNKNINKRFIGYNYKRNFNRELIYI